MSTPAQQREAKRKAEGRARRIEAFRLRRAGFTYEEIAQQVGYSSRHAAHRAINSFLEKQENEEANGIRKMQNARYEWLLTRCVNAIQAGNLEMVSRAVQVLNRIDAINGVNMPVKIAPTSPDGQTEWTGKDDSELIAEFERLLEAAKQATD